MQQVNICPLCNNKNKLINHHWYEENNLKTSHHEYICQSCNNILRSKDNSHILPNWETQKQIIINKTLIINKPPRTNKLVTLTIRISPELKERIKQLAFKRMRSSNIWWLGLLTGKASLEIDYS